MHTLPFDAPGHAGYDAAVARALLPLLLTLVACAAEADAPWCEPGLPCAAASEAHCAHGLEARLHGRAALAPPPARTCVARDDATCAAASITCALWGQCHAPPPDHTPTACPAQADRDFAASRDPRCTAGTCVARDDDDCRAARVCHLEGRCAARDGICVATVEGCARSELCRELGWCTPSGPHCRAGGPADCAAAAICRDFGKCDFARGQCDACSRSAACRAEGLCHHRAGRCAATIVSHCQGSLACRRDGRCRVLDGACVR